MELPDTSEPTCPICDDQFDSFRAFSAHHGAMHDRRNALVTLVGEERLKELYKNASEHSVADDLGLNQVTVHKALDEIDVDTSNPQHSEYPNLIQSQGYERFTHKDSQVLHHRLAAVAWFGFESVVDKVVHHKNGIKWDTREDNLEIMMQNEHIHEHGLPEMDTRSGEES